MKPIHLEGYDICLEDFFSDNSEYFEFEYDKETTDSISNTRILIYESEVPSTLGECQEGFLLKLFGDLEADGQEYGYSEYTIEGFDVNELRIGGHNLQSIINNKKGKYLHILMDFNVKGEII